MKRCKMFYDMGELGFEEFAFNTWDEAFKFWTDKKPPGPLVKTIILLSLTDNGYKIRVTPPRQRDSIELRNDLFEFKPFNRFPEYYTGGAAMRRGNLIRNWDFDAIAFAKALERKQWADTLKNWDEIYFKKTGSHLHEQPEHKQE